jgi:hypothetical protein
VVAFWGLHHNLSCFAFLNSLHLLLLALVD